jgi:hypothetical protein
MSLAHIVLGCAAVADNDAKAAAEHRTAIEALEAEGIATWATDWFRQKADEMKVARQ